MRKLCIFIILMMVTSVASTDELLNETFDSGLFPPTGWTIESTNLYEYIWQQNEYASGYADGYSAEVLGAPQYYAPQDELLYTHSLDLTNYSSATITFWNSSYNVAGNLLNNAQMKLIVSTDGSIWEPLWDWPDPGMTEMFTWYPKSIDLFPYLGETIYIGWQYAFDILDPPIIFGDCWFVDDVVVEADIYCDSGVREVLIEDDDAGNVSFALNGNYGVACIAPSSYPSYLSEISVFTTNPIGESTTLAVFTDPDGNGPPEGAAFWESESLLVPDLDWLKYDLSTVSEFDTPIYSGSWCIGMFPLGQIGFAQDNNSTAMHSYFGLPDKAWSLMDTAGYPGNTCRWARSTSITGTK